MTSFETASIVYQQISDHYANAVSSINASVDALYNALVIVTQLDDPDVKIELLDIFEATWNAMKSGPTRPLISSAARLNTYIVTRTVYTSVNSFLDDVSYQVSSDWAALSADAGTPIDAIYVKD